MATINVRVDDDVKKAASAVFSDIGLDMSTAINMFLHQAIMHDGLPFEAKRVPNAETLAALEELRRIQAGEQRAKVYTDVHKMFEELNADGEV